MQQLLIIFLFITLLLNCSKDKIIELEYELEEAHNKLERVKSEFEDIQSKMQDLEYAIDDIESEIVKMLS